MSQAVWKRRTYVAVYRLKYSFLFSDGLFMMHNSQNRRHVVKNSERYLSEVLNALKDFDEVLLLDNGSTDRTFEIARAFPMSAQYKHDFIGFGPMKNLAARLAQNDWIFQHRQR